MKLFLRAALLVSLSLFMSATALADTLAYHDGDVLGGDTTWEGAVLVDGVLFVPETVTLTIKPGTVVRFTKSDAEYRESGVSEAVIPGSGIRVEGTVIALGDEKAPILFTSAENEHEPGDWGCLFFDHSKGSSFRYCRFEYARYTIHAHFSSLDVSRSVLTKNVDGSRLGYSKVAIEHCDITGNTGKGLNFANCRNTVRYCNITGNYEGIFLNEHDSKCVIEENNIHSNTRFDLSLGEFHDEDIVTGVNWWGSLDRDTIAARVYDKTDDPEIGEAHIMPAKREIPNAGVDGLEVRLNWKFKTGGFVDSSPAIEGGRVYFGSWDHNFYCVDQKTGELIWKFETGDCVDSSPAVYEGKVYFGSWDRNIYCLDAVTGKEVWRFEMEPSNFDDHRQASPLLVKGFLIMGGFNGNVYCLKADYGNLVWKFKTGGPIRSKPFLSKMQWTWGGVVGGIFHNEAAIVSIGSGDCKLHGLQLSDSKYGTMEIPEGEAKPDCWDMENLLSTELSERFSFKAGGPVYSSPIVTDEGIGYFGSQDGKVYCMDYYSEKELWSFKTGGRIEYSSSLLLDNIVLIGSTDGNIYALDNRTGQPKWNFDTGGVIYSSPRTSKEMVVIANNDGSVYWLDDITGSPKAAFHIGEAVQGLSTAYLGMTLAGSRDGYLYSLSIGK